MSLKLSDNDRTLLSAYMDGELSFQELQQAEQLLGDSEEARTYLGHLRSVRSFSTAAFPTVSSGLAGAAAGKLSGGAISAAAKKSALVKGFTLGGWGATGLVAAAASVALGVALTAGGDRSDPPVAHAPHAARASSAPTSAVDAAAPIDVDTNALLVPPMTPSEMVRFAVDGTVPIDAKRKQYLTLAPHGRDSMVVALRDKPPADDFVALDDVEPSEWRELDSVHRAIRTSLLNYGNKGIAISCDIPSLRLKALEHLERIGPKLPATLREELEVARRQADAARESLRWAENNRARYNARWSERPRIPYVVLSFEQIEQNGAPERIRIPDPVSFPAGTYNLMLVDGASLDELRAMTPAEVAPPVPPTVYSSATMAPRHPDLRQRQAPRAFNPTGELPSHTSAVVDEQQEQETSGQSVEISNGNMLLRSDGKGQMMINGGNLMINGGDHELMLNDNGNEVMIRINGDTIVHKVRNALRQADSMLRRLDQEMPDLYIKNGKGTLRDRNGRKQPQSRSEESGDSSSEAGSQPR